jgi:hypothetical protein
MFSSNYLNTVLTDLVKFINDKGGKMHRIDVLKYMRRHYNVDNDLILNAFLDSLYFRSDVVFPELQIIGNFFCTTVFFDDFQKSLNG